MRTIKTNVYLFDELTDAAKEKAREWWRRGQLDDSYWSESVIDCAKDVGKLLGFDISDVYWSGFSSQGDGACFVGTWQACDVEADKFKKDGWTDKELIRLVAELDKIGKQFPASSFRVKHSVHYQHEMCTDFTVDMGIEDNDDPLYQATIQNADEVEDDLIEAARDFMRWIYKTLEAEWDYVNADEQVDDSIRANEYEFEEDGTRA